MKLKTLIGLATSAGLLWLGYQYVSTQSQADVLAYKAYSKALSENDQSRLRRLSPEYYAATEQAQHGLLQRLNGDVRLRFHWVLDRRVSPDGKRVQLRVKEFMRMDPRNVEPSLFGREGASTIHSAVLVRHGDQWQIARFSGRSTNLMASLPALEDTSRN